MSPHEPALRTFGGPRGGGGGDSTATPRGPELPRSNPWIWRAEKRPRNGPDPGRSVGKIWGPIPGPLGRIWSGAYPRPYPPEVVQEGPRKEVGEDDGDDDDGDDAAADDDGGGEAERREEKEVPNILYI